MHPDPTRIEAISDFSRPTDQTALRSFLGMAQQLAFFIPDYAHATVVMHFLLANRRAFLWTDSQEFEFKTLKTLLTKNMQTNHFDSSHEVHILTNESRHFSIGFALVQYSDKGEPKIITCGLKSLSETQRRYATIEHSVWLFGGHLPSVTFI